MKKTLLFFAVLFATAFGYSAQAVESHTVACTAGNLATVAASYLTTVTNLTVTGTIDARDFKTMRDAMPLLEVIDLSGTTVPAYTGTAGTAGTTSTVYLANEIPINAFYKKTSLKTFIYSSSVSTIGDRAFYNCVGLTGSLIIPSSVKTIGEDAFYCCSRLTGSLTIPSSVTTIGLGAFFRCSGFTGSLTISSSVTTILISTFNGCNGFTGSLILPSSLTTICSYAFFYCSGITSIYAYSATPINMSSTTNAFYNINKTTCILYVPVGSKSLYKAADQWKDFTNIVEGFPTSINEISSNSITLHPNPTNSTITVSELSSLASDKAITLSITDVSGNTLLTKSIEPSLNSATIDVSNLRSGAYVAVIQSSNGNVVKRFLKR